MKTKIKILLISGLSLLAIFTASIANAGWDASSGQTCYGQGCKLWHNAGITHGQYPNGTNFATFNNYKDMVANNGQAYTEQQFLLIESGMAAASGYPIKTPWDSGNPYNFNSGTNYNINFINDQPQRIGFWIYMHNNGVADQYDSNNTKVKFKTNKLSGNSYNPYSWITAANAKPNVKSDVTITGNKDFNLIPKEVWIGAEDGNYQKSQTELSNLMSTTGMLVESRRNNNGRFASSLLHYVTVYVEFEAVPQTPPLECRSLNITDPSQLLVNVDDNGFNNENLAFTVDKDSGSVSGYRIHSNNGTITFNNNGSNIQINEVNNVNQYSATMDGGPDNPNSNETVWVNALRANGTAWPDCIDYFTVHLEEDQPPVCEVFNTNPGSLGEQEVPLNEFTPIVLEGPLDSDGNPYRPGGNTPIIKYCFDNPGIDFYPDNGTGIVNHPNGDLQCAVEPLGTPMSVQANQAGTMTISVVTAEDECNDSFDMDFGYEGECDYLEFTNADEFTEDQTQYCVEINVDPTVDDYRDHVSWIIRSDGGNGSIQFAEITPLDETCIDLANYEDEYTFEVNDSLFAEALDIGGDCEAELESEDLTCDHMELDRAHFERGRDNEVCIDDIDPNDYPFSEVEVTVDSDETYTLEVEDDCFTLDEDMLEDASVIDVWIADDCEDNLTREVKPPEFDKNVKSQGGTGFSTRAIANFTDGYVDYRITYEHKNDIDQDVTITDTIGLEGFIQGYIANPDDPNYEDRPKGGRIDYDEGSMVVRVDGDQIFDCNDDDADDLCYQGSIGSVGGVRIKQVPPRPDGEVVITYRGNIEGSAVNPTNCSDPNHPLWESGICGEFYPNTAYFEDEGSDSGLDVFEGNDSAEVVIPCPFIIIRSGGEVFMENPFDYGVDTLSCSEFENIPTPLITPTYEPPQTTPSTGGEGVALIQAFNERLCNSEAAKEAGYGGAERLSSLICEITLKTSEDLTQFAIAQDIQRNIDLFARYDKDLTGLPSVNGSSSLPSNTSNVYVKDDGDLTLSGTFNDGAQTIVVLGHDLIIDGDLLLDDSGANLSDPRTIPSLAVIVIGGDILVKGNVKETNGVFFVMENADGNGGQMCEKDCADDDSLNRYNDLPFVHYGSIYGDIEHLFKYRTFAGDPSKLEAAVLIKFDSRVFLNTPPLLNELVDVTQEVF